MRNVVLLCLGVASVASVACRPPDPAPELSPEPRLDAFARELERSLEAHAWQEILDVAEARHHRLQVTEHGMPEPQYVAELFGLHRTGNNIRRGERITWSDLERIEEVRLETLTAEGDRYTLTGEVRLTGGETLRLRAWIVEREGEFRLTGGLG